jgi:hypothetical protein
MSQANRYLGGFCSSQGIFPPQINQGLLIVWMRRLPPVLLRAPGRTRAAVYPGFQGGVSNNLRRTGQLDKDFWNGFLVTGRGDTSLHGALSGYRAFFGGSDGFILSLLVRIRHKVV